MLCFKKMKLLYSMLVKNIFIIFRFRKAFWGKLLRGLFLFRGDSDRSFFVYIGEVIRMVKVGGESC